MDKYTEMLVFSKAADLGSFSAAARELDLTPSAVSKLITRLEDRLGHAPATRPRLDRATEIYQTIKRNFGFHFLLAFERK